MNEEQKNHLWLWIWSMVLFAEKGRGGQLDVYRSPYPLSQIVHGVMGLGVVRLWVVGVVDLSLPFPSSSSLDSMNCIG